MSTHRRAKVLLVDDNDVDREAVRRLVANRLDLVDATTVSEGIAALDGSIDCVLLDYRLPDSQGLGALRHFCERGVPVILVTGKGSEALAVSALTEGAVDYLRKHDLSADMVVSAVERAVTRRRLERDIADKANHLRARLAELEEANAEIRARELRLRGVMAQFPGLLWTTDAAQRLTSAFGDWRGAGAGEPRTGRPVEDAFDGASSVGPAHARALTGRRESFAIEGGERSWDCSVEPLRSSDGAVVGTIGVALDVTEHRRLESQLRHSQKLEAVGRLAGGVAHDFNNLLTAIGSFATFAAEELPGDSAVLRDLAEISDATRRGAALTRQLLTFSRQHPEMPQNVDVGALLSGLQKLLARLLGEDISLELRVEPRLPPVHVDPGNLEQVVVNLVVNARDAMPAGGRLVVHAYAQPPEPPGPETALVIDVTDEGSGIAEEHLPKLFDPFFTTKPPGKGSGLGLATCHGIIARAGGSIGVAASGPGQGTTMRVVLPAAAVTTRRSAPTRRPPAAGGTETILVVEDETPVRTLIVRALTKVGYRTLSAESGAAALRLLADGAPELDLVVTDLVLPGMNGVEIAAAVTALQPGAAVLLMSGYAPDSIRERGFEANYPLLPKPFTPEVLRTRVREILDARASEPPARAASAP